MIGFADLVRQHARLRGELEPAVADVLFGGELVLGRKVADFEADFAAYCHVAHGVAVNSGTSALHLALLVAGVGKGDEVITSAFTFIATAAAIRQVGARPVLVDVDPSTVTLAIDGIEPAITPRTKAIVPVHLYGHPVDMDPLMALATRYGLAVIEDAAQAHGAEYYGRRVGTLGHAACFSFYPSKNLGAAGDAGLITTNRADWAARLRRLRDWGQAAPYEFVDEGFNYRMASVQAAVLGVKLRHLDSWNRQRRHHARAYDAAIMGPTLTPLGRRPWATHAYHIYAVRAPVKRDAVRQAFARRGIETRVHYPAPIHLCAPFVELGYRAGDFPEAERAAAEVLSLPVHPELTPEQADAVTAAVRMISRLPIDRPHHELVSKSS